MSTTTITTCDVCEQEIVNGFVTFDTKGYSEEYVAGPVYSGTKCNFSTNVLYICSSCFNEKIKPLLR